MRWALGDAVPLEVQGHGRVDCSLYAQPGRLILHLVNLTSAGTGRAPIDDLVPVGPLEVRVRLPKDVSGSSVRLMVAGSGAEAKVDGGRVRFEVRSIADHELAVIE